MCTQTRGYWGGRAANGVSTNQARPMLSKIILALFISTEYLRYLLT